MLVGRSDSKKLHRPPSYRLQDLAQFFTPRSYTKIFEPILRDLQDEQLEALATGSLWKARWVVLRGRFSFWAAVAVYLNGSVVRWLVKLAKP